MMSKAALEVKVLCIQLRSGDYRISFLKQSCGSISSKIGEFNPAPTLISSLEKIIFYAQTRFCASHCVLLKEHYLQISLNTVLSMCLCEKIKLLLFLLLFLLQLLLQLLLLLTLKNIQRTKKHR